MNDKASLTSKTVAEIVRHTDLLLESGDEVACLTAGEWRRIKGAIGAHETTEKRTPKDYAIEHAEYLATAAESYIKSIDDEARVLETTPYDYGEDASDEERAEEAWRKELSSAAEKKADHHGALINAIYEFRKRAERARSPVETTARREYHANGTYWSGVPTVDMPCDFCTLPITDHDPRTHACPPEKASGECCPFRRIVEGTLKRCEKPKGHGDLHMVSRFGQGPYMWREESGEDTSQERAGVYRNGDPI
jgi:hypothetical protein